MLDQSRGIVLLQVRIPDVCVPDQAPGPGLMAMSAGDFVEVYSRLEYAGTYDAVATCFFVDCAHNIIEYTEIIHRILKVCGFPLLHAIL